jgi:hypothetical protein
LAKVAAFQFGVWQLWIAALVVVLSEGSAEEGREGERDVGSAHVRGVKCVVFVGEMWRKKG